MKKQTYGILDVAKFISALLVVAIHCAPLIQISEPANFVLVQIFARLAVPFFFLTSGWLFFRKINPHKGWKDPENVKALGHYWKRIAKIYLVWSILYLPLVFLSWYQGGFDATTLVRFVRDFLCNGTYYHLWFLPALLLGVPFVYLLYTTLKKRWMLWLSIALYLIGMMINVYGNVLLDVPFLGRMIALYTSVFSTSRNGLFFAPVYLVMGIYAQNFLHGGTYKKQSGLALLISFALYCGEAFLLRQCGIMHDLTSMYLMLVPTIFFLFIFLMQFSLPQSKWYPQLRAMSLLTYVSHIYFIFILLNVFQLPNIIVYLGSILCSCIFSLGILHLSKRWRIAKVLM